MFKGRSASLCFNVSSINTNTLQIVVLELCDQMCLINCLIYVNRSSPPPPHTHTHTHAQTPAHKHKHTFFLPSFLPSFLPFYLYPFPTSVAVPPFFWLEHH